MNEYNQGHATAQKIADDVCILEPVVYEDFPESSQDATFNTDEIAHFIEKGFVVKRNLIDDRDALRQAVDFLWKNVPRQILKREDPSTWLDDPHEKWTEQDGDRVGWLFRENWKMRSRGAYGIGTQSFLVDRIANHRSMRALASQLLGTPVELARRVRGVYGVLPKPPSEQRSLSPHGDYMASQISAMVCANDIPPHCGGFTVWPGSHTRLHTHWDTVHGGTVTGKHMKGYPRERDNILRDTVPVELSGSAGDVMFWHPRLLHSAGVNHSVEEKSPIVRIIIPCDYQRQGYSYFDDLEYGPGPVYQYWVDTRNFREDVPSTPNNMWSNWNL